MIGTLRSPGKYNERQDQRVKGRTGAEEKKRMSGRE
jgi:hypothetical protein